MKPRRLMLVSDAPTYGGAERYLTDLALGLDRSRWAPELVLTWEGAVDGWAERLTAAGLPVRRLPKIATLKQDPVPVLKFFKHVLARRPALLHFNLADPRSCNAHIVGATLAGRGRFIVTEHLPSSPFDGEKLPFRHRLAMRKTAVTIVNTRAAADIVRGRPQNRSQLAVIANGIEDPGAPSEARREAARAAMGLGDHHGPLIGWIGRLVDQKNPDLMIEGARRLVAERRDAIFVMVGAGEQEAILRDKLRRLGLEHHVRILGHRDDAPELVYGFDLLVNTSHYEGMPYVMLEAMHAAVPILATRNFASEAVIAPLATGWLVQGGDGNVLGDALQRALEDPERLERYGRTGRERARLLHSREAMAAATERAYTLR